MSWWGIVLVGVGGWFALLAAFVGLLLAAHWRQRRRRGAQVIPLGRRRIGT